MKKLCFTLFLQQISRFPSACRSHFTKIDPYSTMKRSITSDSMITSENISETPKCKVAKIHDSKDLPSELIRNDKSISKETIDQLESQLGFRPYNVIGIGSYDNNNQPTVAVLYPLNANAKEIGRYSAKDGLKPFPTTFWMTSPALRAQVSELERSGWVQKLQQRLLSKEKYKKLMIGAHKLYSEERWSMLKDDDRDLVSERKWENVIREVGIAGIRDPMAVKCLHCHYCHFLARPDHNNIVGKWVGDLLRNEYDSDSDSDGDSEDHSKSRMIVIK